VSRYTTSLLVHTRAIQQCLPRFGAEAKVDLASLMIDVRGRNRYYLLYPQYVCKDQGQRSYSRQLVDNATGFMGWLPYLEKRFPIGSDKFAFKEFCQKSGLRTPQMWRGPVSDLRDFVVKHELSSFSKGLHGPFRTYDATEPAQALNPQSGYYEAFIRGRVLKAFYWEDRLACLELKDMPSVSGDGASSLRELVREKVKGRTPEDEWKTMGEVAAFQDLTLDTAVPKDLEVLIDYRYGSPAYKDKNDNENEVKAVLDTPLGEQLSKIGSILWRGIPDPMRPATLYTVDGILDDEGHVWLLEMNCNPICHPDIYPYMFETLFGPAKPFEQPAPRAPAPGPFALAASASALAGSPSLRSPTTH
jgi:hypothetical protein